MFNPLVLAACLLPLAFPICHASTGQRSLAKRATTVSPSDMFIDQIYKKYADGSTEMSQKRLTDLFGDMGLIVGSTDTPDAKKPHTHTSKCNHKHKHKRHEPVDPLMTTCHSPNALTTLFGLTAESSIGRDKFLEMSPALIHMKASKVCTAPQPEKKEKQEKTASAFEAWGGAMGANLIVTLVALSGALLVPILRKKNASTEFAMTFMMALAVGSLLGDALLHLIPQALGAHSHDEPSHTHSEEEHDHYKFVWIGSVTILGAYSFFLLEKFLHHIMAKKCSESNDETTRFGGIKPVVWLILAGDGFHNFVDGVTIGVAFGRSWGDGMKTSLAVLFHEIPHELGDFAVLLSSGLSIPKALFFNCLGNIPAFLGSILALTAIPADSKATNWILAFTAGNFLYLALVDLLPSLFGGGGHTHDHGAHTHDHGHAHTHSHTHETRADDEKTITGLNDSEAGGEGIHRKPMREKWGSALAIHTGVILGWATMVVIAIYGE